MLIVGDNLTSYTLGAGEPFLLQVAFQESDGTPSDLTGRAFVLSFYKANRAQAAKIDGVVEGDGSFLRFEEDGSFSEMLFNQGVIVELAERLRSGRNVIATGTMTVKVTAGSVAPLDTGPIGDFAVRVVFKEAGLLGDRLSFSQSDVAYVAPSVSVAPTIRTRPSIMTDGTPQVGELMAGQSGTYLNGSVTARAWLMGATVLASSVAYAPISAGSITYQETVTGNGGTITAESDPVVVAAAAPVFSTLPSISPSSGLAGATFTATDGTVTNGSVVSRRWILGGVVIGTGLTVAPGVAGALVLENTAAGIGGATVATSAAVAVSAPSTLLPIGMNLEPGAAYTPEFSIFSNLLDGAFYQNPNNNNAQFILPDGAPVPNGGSYLKLPHGPMSGNLLEFTWTGSPGRTYSLGSNSPDLTYSDVSYPTSQTMRFRETFAYDGHTPSFGGLTFDNIDPNSPPVPVSIRVVGQAAQQSAIFNDGYINFQKTFPGPKRSMDWLDINHPNPAVTFAQQRKKIEQLIDLSNTTNTDIWFNVMPYMADAEITKAFQAIDTGVGTSNGVGLKTGLKIWVEWGNEIWNTGFPVTYALMRNRYCARTGEADQGDGGYVQNLKEHAFQHNHVMALLEAAIPSYATRCIRVVATNGSPDDAPSIRFHYDQFKAAGGTHYDAHAQAPYPQHHYTSGDDTSPAALAPLWAQAIQTKMALYHDIHAATIADGKRYVTYEGGPDVPLSGLPGDAAIAFKASPMYYDLVRDMLEQWKTLYGDVFNFYNDLQIGGYGLLPYEDAPNPYGFNAVKDAVAGTYVNKPVIGSTTAPAAVTSTFATPAPAGYTLSDSNRTATGSDGAANAVIRATTSHIGNGSGLWWVEAVHLTNGVPELALGLITSDALGTGDLGSNNSLVMYFDGNGGPAYYVGNSSADPSPVLLDSGLSLTSGHVAMLVDEVQQKVTFYGGTKKSDSYPLPPGLINGATQNLFMRLGTGDVASWTATSAKPAGSVEWG